MTSGCPLTDNKKTVACLDNTHVSHRIGGVGHSMSKVQRDRLAAESSRLLLRCNVRLNHTVLAWPKIEGANVVIALPDKSLTLPLEEVAVNVADTSPIPGVPTAHLVRMEYPGSVFL